MGVSEHGGADRRLTPAEIEAQLAATPGWYVLADGSAIYTSYRFEHAVQAILFTNFFGAVARLTPFDLAFMIDIEGLWAGVGLGAENPDGIILGAFVVAEVAEAVARLNFARPGDGNVSRP
jgi:hypothetical protein